MLVYPSGQRHNTLSRIGGGKYYYYKGAAPSPPQTLGGICSEALFRNLAPPYVSSNSPLCASEGPHPGSSFLRCRFPLAFSFLAPFFWQPQFLPLQTLASQTLVPAIPAGASL